jgi:5-methylcytosine-specific restriction enzyme subunit McrC
LNLKVFDCSPFDPRDARENATWLSRLAIVARTGDLVVRLQDGREDEPLVMCDPDGAWRAGRYIGSVIFEGKRLDILPRFGADTLRAWFSGALNLALAETSGQLTSDDWFVPWLLANVWSRAFVAARHGLPALRADSLHEGLSVTGRIDVAGTVRLRALRRGVASVRRDKTLRHAISAAIVAGHRELSRWMRKGTPAEWMPERVRDLMLHLEAAVGSQPRVPMDAEIERVRLTPITQGYRRLAELSARIARRRGLAASASDQNECQGVLLDVAELWELYVLACARRAWPSLDVVHGTHHVNWEPLLRNAKGDGLANLKPDLIVSDRGRSLAVIDAKYKRLWVPDAPAREDVYQMVAYLSRFRVGCERYSGALAYPVDEQHPIVPDSESRGPWKFDSLTELRFITLPHRIEDATLKLRDSFSWPNS